MSGASIPYHLRPHKAVDRRIFLDLLARLERWQPVADFTYLSMGAYPLEDHKLIHRLLGVTRLIAFDMDEDVVSRQMFNRPISSCRCVLRKSGEVVSNLQALLNECDLGDATGVIVWLDYTSPKKIGVQVREFESLLDSDPVGPGSIVRVTVNANPRDQLQPQNGPPRPIQEIQAEQFQSLKNKLNDYLPTWASPELMNEEGLPRILAAAFSRAALNAFPPGGELEFLPLSLVRYADGQQMLSITGTVVRTADLDAIREKLALDKWPFASQTWDTIHKLVVPDLTLRERLFLEREIVESDATQIAAGLNFKAFADTSVGEFVSSYQNYYRFYPTLFSADP